MRPSLMAYAMLLPRSAHVLKKDGQGRVASMFSRTIFKMTTSGMEKIIPIMPQTQKEKAVNHKEKHR